MKYQVLPLSHVKVQPGIEMYGHRSVKDFCHPQCLSLERGGLSLHDSQDVPSENMTLFVKSLKDAPQQPAPMLLSTQSPTVCIYCSLPTLQVIFEPLRESAVPVIPLDVSASYE